MDEQKYCHICGEKLIEGVEVCKKCKAVPSEKVLSECRGMRYANRFIISAYVNLILTNHRLLAFEDIKGSIFAGVQAGVIGGSANHGRFGRAIGDTVSSSMGKTTERIVAKGLNGSIKFEVPLSSIVSVETENKKSGIHTFINVSDRKPLRVVLGTSFDGTITGDMFREILVNTALPN